MESKEYFEKVMQDYNQNSNGRSMRKYCNDEAVDYDWLIRYKKNYPLQESIQEPSQDIINGWVLYAKWFTDGRFLKPEFVECKVPHELSREILILILSTSVQTKTKI